MHGFDITDHMSWLLGVKQSGMWRGTHDAWNATVDLIKQDRCVVDVLDTILLSQ